MGTKRERVRLEPNSPLLSRGTPQKRKGVGFEPSHPYWERRESGTQETEKGAAAFCYPLFSVFGPCLARDRVISDCLIAFVVGDAGGFKCRSLNSI